jgi:GGDEF domain-containing protein
MSGDEVHTDKVHTDAASAEAALRALVALLLDTVSSDSLASPGAIADLAPIRRHIAGSSHEDLSEATTELATWLPRWRAEMEQRLDGLSPARTRNGTRNRIAVKPGMDPCTGLPGRGEAEKAIREIAAGRHIWAVVLILQRLPAINARFGRSVGDHLLFTEARYLKQQFSGNDRLFRWIGPSFVALMDRPNSPDAVRSEVHHMCSARFQASVVLDSRTVLIPLSVRWHLLASSDYSSATEFIGTLQALISDAEVAAPPAAPAPSPRTSANAPSA